MIVATILCLQIRAPQAHGLMRPFNCSGRRMTMWLGSGCSQRLILLCCSLGMATVVSVPSYAQRGNNAVINSGGTPVPSPSFFDATQFGGADPCVQIQTAFGALPSTGGTVDARGLVSGTTTTLTCSVNPIPSGAKGRLLLSAGTYLAQVPWVIQSNDVNIIGAAQQRCRLQRVGPIAQRSRFRFLSRCSRAHPSE